MLGIKITTTDETAKVKRAVDAAKVWSLKGVAYQIRQAARESVRRGRGPSAPGQPPHTRRGLLRRAILYSATRESAVIGPAFSMIGTGAQSHEHGGRVPGRREQFPKRPVMGPALQKNLGRFAIAFRGAVAKQ